MPDSFSRWANAHRRILALLMVVFVASATLWGPRLFLWVQLALLPLLAFWLPLLKAFPLLYDCRARQLLKRHYVALEEVENALEHSRTLAEWRRNCHKLNNLHRLMRDLSRKLPGYLRHEIYHWRLHIALVRSEAHRHLRRLRKMQRKPFARPVERDRQRASLFFKA